MARKSKKKMQASPVLDPAKSSSLGVVSSRTSGGSVSNTVPAPSPHLNGENSSFFPSPKEKADSILSPVTVTNRHISSVKHPPPDSSTLLLEVHLEAPASSTVVEPSKVHATSLEPKSPNSDPAASNCRSIPSKQDLEPKSTSITLGKGNSSGELPPAPVLQEDVTPTVAPMKPSWTEVVQCSGQKMSKKGTPFVLESGEVCVQIPNSVITKNKKCWENFIIGQFQGKLPTPGTLHAIVNGIWSNKLRDITVSRLTERAYLIRIPHAATRQRVLAQGMWHIDNQAMFVAKWEPGLSPEVPELTSIPVWLEFRKVPLHFFNIDGLEYIAGLIGDPKFLHPSTANMTNMEVAKVFTIVDPTKPLPEAISVQFESGHYHRIEVSSPWLPPICEHCQAVGHSIKSCPSAPITCSICSSSGHSTDKCARIKKEKSEKKGHKPASSEIRHPKSVNVSTSNPQSSSLKVDQLGKASSSNSNKQPPGPNEGIWVKKTSAIGIKINSPQETPVKAKATASKEKDKQVALPKGYNSSDVAGGSGFSSDDSSGSDWSSGDDDNPDDSEHFVPYVSRKLMRQLRALRQKQSNGSGPKYLH